MKHLEHFDVSDAAFAESAEFKRRETKVLWKLDLFIAPLMGAFNFIVSLYHLFACSSCSRG